MYKKVAEPCGWLGCIEKCCFPFVRHKRTLSNSCVRILAFMMGFHIFARQLVLVRKPNIALNKTRRAARIGESVSGYVVALCTGLISFVLVCLYVRSSMCAAAQRMCRYICASSKEMPVERQRSTMAFLIVRLRGTTLR